MCERTWVGVGVGLVNDSVSHPALCRNTNGHKFRTAGICVSRNVSHSGLTVLKWLRLAVERFRGFE